MNKYTILFNDEPTKDTFLRNHVPSHDFSVKAVQRIEGVWLVIYTADYQRY